MARRPPLPRLSVDLVGESAPVARLADYVWAGAAPDLALHANTDHTRTLVRTRLLGGGDAGVRWVEALELDEEPDEDGVLPCVTTRFDLGPTHFAETGRWRPGEDTNLHRRAMVLPAELRVGERLLPVAGAGLTLEWCGLAELVVGGAPEVLRVMRLRVEQGGVRLHQWLGEGVGELALGAADGPFTRWILAWEGGGARRFGALDPSLRAAAFPEPDLERDGAPFRAGP